MSQLPDTSEPPPAHVAPVILPRWVQLVLLPLAILGVVAILQAAGPVVLLFTIAGILVALIALHLAIAHQLWHARVDPAREEVRRARAKRKARS